MVFMRSRAPLKAAWAARSSQLKWMSSISEMLTSARDRQLVDWSSSIEKGALVEDVVACGAGVGDRGFDLAVANSCQSHL